MKSTRSLVLSLTVLVVSGIVIPGCDRADSDLNGKYRFEETITIDGRKRSYTINLPPNYYSTESLPLIIAMHGGGGSSAQFERTSKLSEKSDAAGFIVVYPNGSGVIQTWNAGLCCGYAINNNVNDVKFISMLIDKLVSDYKVNAKRVYATGHSNGGMMSYRLACELSDKIAAIAPNGCTMVNATPCNPSRAVPILHMHSKLDQHVPYMGGVGNGITGINCPPIDDVLNFWSENNECTTTKELQFSNSEYSVYTWAGCSSGNITYYLTDDGGHGWPGGLPGGPNSDTPSDAINANDLILDFFGAYQMP